MVTSAISLLVIYTADLAACEEFYRGLGLRLVRERHGPGPEHLAATLSDGGVLEFYPARSQPPTGRLRLGLTVDADPGATGLQLPPGRHLLRDPDGRTVDLQVVAR
ncbi:MULTISPECIES: VOC family protein [unclassified Frankia]|uniref:VOC family protein n=1 Tax=unclassified Frankia TaxID=2632575 RepID=UPI002023C9FB